MADNDKGIEGRPPDPFVAARINDPGRRPRRPSSSPGCSATATGTASAGSI